MTEVCIFGIAGAMTGTSLDVLCCTTGSLQHSPGSRDARKGPAHGYSLLLLPVQGWQLYWAECASAVILRNLVQGRVQSLCNIGLPVQEQDSAGPREGW